MKPDLQHAAVQILRRIDFGHRNPKELERLEYVTDLLGDHGWTDPDLDAAIRYFKSDPERARRHVYGPTPNGDGRGALQRIMDEREEDMTHVIADTIRYRGAVYRLASALPTYSVSTVWHVGSMDPAQKGDDSYEGAGLSVSEHPEEWATIARLPGDVYELTKPSGKFLDFYAMSDQDQDVVRSWGLKKGLADEATVYRLYYYDSEDDSERYFELDSREDAELELEDYEEGEARIEEVPGELAATAALRSRTKNANVGVGSLVMELLATVYVEDQTQLDGVWWFEDLAVESLSAPRGVIVPSKVSSWEIEKL